MNRFKYDPKEITENKEALVLEIRAYLDSEDKKNRDEVILKTLALMEGYMNNLAHQYASKSRLASHEDYMNEMISVVIDKLDKLKLDDKSKAVLVTSYLYYWLVDTCQKHYCSMERGVSVSVSKARKINKSGDETEMMKLSKPLSLNRSINSEDDKEITFQDTLTSNESSVYVELYKKDFRNFILKNYGKEILEIFTKIYINGYKGTKIEHRKLEPLINKIKDNKDLADTVTFLINAREGLI